MNLHQIDKKLIGRKPVILLYYSLTFSDAPLHVSYRHE